ncbi:MAG: hypothetical protein ACJ8KA_16610 [Sulfurifustis sp.]
MRRASLAIALVFPLLQSAELYARAIGEPEQTQPVPPPPPQKQPAPPPPAPPEEQPPPEQPTEAEAPKGMELSTKILIGGAVALGLAALGGGGGGGGGGSSAPSSTSSGR